MTDHPATTTLQPKLTLAGAKAILEAALAQADRIGMQAITVTVVDDGGHPILLARNNAPYPTIEISAAKARTSATFGISSEIFGTHTQSDNPHTRADLTTYGGVTGVAGGEPIRVNNQLIGGVGVSGGSEEQDASCAKAGAAILG